MGKGNMQITKKYSFWLFKIHSSKIRFFDVLIKLWWRGSYTIKQKRFLLHFNIILVNRLLLQNYFSIIILVNRVVVRHFQFCWALFSIEFLKLKPLNNAGCEMSNFRVVCFFENLLHELKEKYSGDERTVSWY